MVTFFCRYCYFKYNPKSGRTQPPELCPNCGKRDTLNIEPSAEEIIRESSKEE